MKKEEFNEWVEKLSPKDQKKARGYFHVIRRDSEGKLMIVPYSEEYKDILQELSKILKEASNLTKNVSLKEFLVSRAEAFLSNDYYDSEVSWLHLDSKIDVTMGPYEVYKDHLFAAKSSYEAYIGIRDDAETEKLVGSLVNFEIFLIYFRPCFKV